MPKTGFLGWAFISGSSVSVAGGLSDKQVNFMSGSTISGSSGLLFDYTTNTLSASNNISASAYYGDGSNLTGVGGGGSPGGSNTQIQFNDATAFGASADLTYNDTTNTLAVTGTLVATGSGGPGYIFSLSGSTIDSSYGGGSVTGKYVLAANDKILIDAGPGATSEVSLIAAAGKVTMGAGGLGGMPEDILGARLDPSQAGSVNTIASYTGAGINVHSANTLSLSGSTVSITGSVIYLTSSAASVTLLSPSTGKFTVAGVGDAVFGSISGKAYIESDSGVDVISSANHINLTASSGTRITGALDQGNDTGANYFRLSTNGAHFMPSINFYSGETFYPPSALPSKATSPGALYYTDASGVQQAFTASVTTSGAEALSMLALGSTNHDGFLLRGFFKYEGAMSASISSSTANMSFDSVKQVYASSITPSYLTTVQPTGSGDVVRVIGNSLDSKLFYFNPSPDFVTV
jgi:hypothetical protein